MCDMSHLQTSVTLSCFVGSDSSSLLSSAARGTIGHGNSCFKIALGWLSFAWEHFDSGARVSGYIIKILARRTEDWSTSLWLQVLVFAAGIAVLYSYGPHVWPSTFSGVAGGDGGHWNGQSKLWWQKYDGFAGNCAVGQWSFSSTG